MHDFDGRVVDALGTAATSFSVSHHCLQELRTLLLSGSNAMHALSLSIVHPLHSSHRCLQEPQTSLLTGSDATHSMFLLSSLLCVSMFLGICEPLAGVSPRSIHSRLGPRPSDVFAVIAALVP